MAIDIKAELLRFLSDHVKTHGATHYSERYINQCCDDWLPKFGQTAEKVRGEAIKFWVQSGGILSPTITIPNQTANRQFGNEHKLKA